MGCHGGFSLDESTRRSWYNPEDILEDVGLQSGMVFADIGCGDGFFSFMAARKVGPSGKVFSVDSDIAAVQKLKHGADKQGLKNIQATRGYAEEVVFCRQCVDIVFYSMVLHDFLDPVRVLFNAKQMIKPNGLLVDLDWKKKRVDFGPPEHIRFSEDKAFELIKNAGFAIENAKDAGMHHYLITARAVEE